MASTFRLYGKAEDTLEQLIQAFESGQVAPAIARTVIEAAPDQKRPIDSWSWTNQVLARILLGTDDARGFRQWLEAGRVVRQGSKAGFILVPCFRTFEQTVTDETTGKDEIREGRAIYGFKSAPVFAFEQTDVLPAGKRRGAAYEPRDFRPAEMPPLHAVAEGWGIRVAWSPFSGAALGSCTVDGARIDLHTHDVETWLHELAHAAEVRTRGKRLNGGQHWDQEVVAELSGAALCAMLGIGGVTGKAYGYIRSYAEGAGLSAGQACLRVMNRVKAVLDLIIAEAKAQGAIATAAA